MSRSPFRLVLLGLWALSCTASPTGRRAVREALEREVEPLPVVAVASPDGRVTLQTEVRGDPWIEPVGAGSALYSLEVPIASDSAIHCLVMPGDQQLAKLMASVLEDEPSSPVSERHLVSVDAGVMGERPFLLVETGGLLAHADREALFEIKVAGVSVGLSTLLCVLDDVGYRQTFRRIVGVIAASIRVQDGGISRSPDHLEVHRTSVDGRVTGFTEARFHHAEDGTWAALVRSHRLEPMPGVVLVGWDSVGFRKSDTRGRIVAEIAALSAPGDGGYELELFAEEGGAYAVRGEAKGRAVQSTLTPPERLTDDRWLASALAEALASRRGEPIVQERWMPQVEPSRPTAVTIRCPIDHGSSPARCELTGGDGPATLEVDDTGSIVRMISRRLDGEEIRDRLLPP